MPFRRAREFEKRKLLRLSIASALAAGMVIAASADARTTKIQILSSGPAFGGYSFAGVGQYEVIKGIASGEIDPNDPLNAVITDIKLAPRNANGHVEYQHNFYILKPVDLGKGAHKVMYEPPNRGGKTFNTLNRSPGGNDSRSRSRAPRDRALPRSSAQSSGAEACRAAGGRVGSDHDQYQPRPRRARHLPVPLAAAGRPCRRPCGRRHACRPPARHHPRHRAHGAGAGSAISPNGAVGRTGCRGRARAAADDLTAARGKRRGSAEQRWRAVRHADDGADRRPHAGCLTKAAGRGVAPR